MQLSFFTNSIDTNIINSWSIRLPLRIDQITPNGHYIYPPTNNTSATHIYRNHLIIPHSTVLSVSRREQSQPVETTRHYPGVRFVGHRDRSHPSPARAERRTSSISREGAPVGVPVCFFPPSSFPVLCTRYIHMQIYSAPSVYARSPTPSTRSGVGLLALVVGAAERVIN